jgi:hypothetical protein
MGKNFYKKSHLSGGAEQVPLPLWQRYCAENQKWKQSILKRLPSHKALIDHMHAQASPGESIRHKEDPNDMPFSDSDTISQPQVIMAKPSALKQPV